MRKSPSHFALFHRAGSGLALMGLVALTPRLVEAQTYAPPADGDYGGTGPFSVVIEYFTNAAYPVANQQTLVVSVYHPNTTIDPSRPSVFFAHGYTSPIGNAADYGALLTNVASQGYNVVFSPYEGGTSIDIAKRFDELTTGFDRAVSRYGLNTTQVGFAGHSYGGGFLPAVIQHEMMGLADAYTAGHKWGGVSAFMYSMAPGYAYDGGGQTGVSGSQTIFFPTNLNVIEQVFNDDTSIADPRLAIDIFYNITTLNSQKDFLTVHGDKHGTPPQVANHFLPNTGVGVDSTSLQAWGIFRHLDALAAYTFTGDTIARQVALCHGAAAETYEGIWSDAVPVAPLAATALPAPSAYSPGPYLVEWSPGTPAVNPRHNFPLIGGPPWISSVTADSGRVVLAVNGPLAGHNYTEQTSPDLVLDNWSTVVSFVPAQSVLAFTNNLGGSPCQFWRILGP